ncbi:MAG: hypothetical protein FJ102_19595 [Deltaproteobacteria bacterium]|nr:hypothetical protein [Deltaproteobacteria bacterium]
MPPLANLVYPWLRAHPARVVGLNAPQGAGKTTLCAELVRRAALDGERWVALSIDDFYLPRAAQVALAARFPGDPLMAVRGGPGTHDIDIGVATLDSLIHDTCISLVPRYDKSAHGGLGDRYPEPDRVEPPVHRVLLEGWILGFVPQGLRGRLAHVDAALAAYAPWTERLGALVQLRMTDPTSVLRWRVEAEQRMRAAGRPGMSNEQAAAYIARFLPLYDVYPAAMAARPPVQPYLHLWIGPDRLPAQPPPGDLP